MKDLIRNYFETSTIHGFSYLIDKYHIIERTFWILSLIVSLICTILLTLEVVTKIKNLPIIIYLLEHQVHASEVSFNSYIFKIKFILNTTMKNTC